MSTPSFDVFLKNSSLFERIQPFLIRLTITDEPGLKSDKLDLVMADQNLDLPQTGELLNVSLGYKETGLLDMGTFAIDGYTLSQTEMHITAHAADFLENFKIHNPVRFPKPIWLKSYKKWLLNMALRQK